MTICRTETGFRDPDFKIAVALGAGMSAEEAADFAECSRSTVFDRKAKNAEFFQLVGSTVRAATAVSIAATLEQSKKKWLAAQDKAQTKIIHLVDSDNDQIALASSKIIVERNEGKALQKIETKIESDVTVTHQLVVIPGAEIKYLLDSLAGTRALLTGGPPEGVIDTDPIDDPPPPSEGGE